MEANRPLPSNRSFGVVFVIFFALVGLLIWWKGGRGHAWFFGATGFTLLLTLFSPVLLAPFNRAWMKLAEWLHRIMSPLILGVIFFGLLTPVAFVMRLAGRDILQRKFDRAAPSYWVRRDPPGPDPAGLPNQF